LNKQGILCITSVSSLHQRHRCAIADLIALVGCTQSPLSRGAQSGDASHLHFFSNAGFALRKSCQPSFRRSLHPLLALCCAGIVIQLTSFIDASIVIQLASTVMPALLS
jgi:hypothetical protein